MTLLARTLARFPLMARLQAKKHARIDAYLKLHLLENPTYDDPKRLNRFEFQAYSQSGEDGIIAEIFRRIGVKNRVFVECGVGDGYECNSLYLLMQGWTGVWIEGNPRFCRTIRRAHADSISDKKLILKEVMITPDTVDDLLMQSGIDDEPDLLSIDTDGNDYWLWKSVQHKQPRVVVIEYNALHRPPVEWIMKENPAHTWTRDTYYGASLSSLEKLGQEKGYTLVGCNFSGGNAFFVRSDLVSDKFVMADATYHYEPLRLFLLRPAGAFPIRLTEQRS